MIVPDLEKTLAEHKKWLESNLKEGKPANLHRASLCGADLRGADLYDANLHDANLRGANLRGANLCDANLHRANLYDANLRGANLRGADIDFSCWPLWCGSFDVIVDRRIAAQLAYHFCRVVCDDPEVVQCQKALYKLANTFHRVGELPRLGDD